MAKFLGLKFLGALLLIISLFISAFEWRDQRCAERVLRLMSAPPQEVLVKAALNAQPQPPTPHPAPKPDERLSVWLQRAQLSFQEAQCPWWGEEVRVRVECLSPCRSFEAVAR